MSALRGLEQVCEGAAEEVMSVWSMRTLLWVSALTPLLLFVSSSPAPAHEPQGVILFDTEGVTSPAEGAAGLNPGEKVVTLVVRSVRSLRGAVLTHEAPVAISQRLATLQLPGEAARLVDPYDGKSPAAIDLGPLEAGSPVILQFAESWAEGTGGVVSFTVEAVMPDGKVLHEAYGQVVGTPGQKPVIHDGLIEFPAHELPPETKP